MHALKAYDLINALVEKGKMIAHKFVKNSSLYQGIFKLVGS